ncbi:hypothetical protein HYR99_28875 [Candidatus Poribacteria bacterium]|nr:hypothetical protein [Candidatus Poribacteria bacterium]
MILIQQTEGNHTVSFLALTPIAINKIDSQNIIRPSIGIIISIIIMILSCDGGLVKTM